VGSPLDCGGTAVVLAGGLGINCGLPVGADLTLTLQALALGIEYDGLRSGSGRSPPTQPTASDPEEPIERVDGIRPPK
jgi:hypothetical protein